MRNGLIVLMLIGTIAGIAAGYFGITERAKFHQDKITAEEKAQEAKEAKTKAVDAMERAEESERKADNRAKGAEEEQSKIAKERDDAKGRTEKAEKEKNDALQDKKRAEDEREAMRIERDDSFKKVDIANEERDKAVGEAASADSSKKTAEATLDETLKKFGELSNEVTILREATEKAKQIATFINKVYNIVFYNNNLGDDNFMKGLELFGTAETKAKKYEAIGLLKESGKKYNEAKKALSSLDEDNKLKDLDERVGNIIKKALTTTKENIECINTLVPLLEKFIKDNPGGEADDQERKTKYSQINERKKKADDFMVEVCDRLLEIIKEYRPVFPPSYDKLAQQFQQKIYERWKTPPRPDESRIPPE